MVRGHVTGYEHGGADARIDYLAEEVLGADVYEDHRPDQQRVIVRIEVGGVARMGY